MKLHQSGDKIIVTELRPMSELMAINDFSLFCLGYKESKQDFVRIRQSSDNEVFCAETGKFHHISKFTGWIPMPIHQPESRSPDKAALYEKLRKLNPREFAELYERNLMLEAENRAFRENVLHYRSDAEFYKQQSEFWAAECISEQRKTSVSIMLMFLSVAAAFIAIATAIFIVL